MRRRLVFALLSLLLATLGRASAAALELAARDLNAESDALGIDQQVHVTDSAIAGFASATHFTAPAGPLALDEAGDRRFAELDFWVVSGNEWKKR